MSSFDVDDDVIPSGIAQAPKYPWFQRPAPSIHFTLALTAVSFTLTFWLYTHRVAALRRKFDAAHFQGSLRVCAWISAYMDNYGYPRFATLKLVTKSLLFLALLQYNFHYGFYCMWLILIVESSLDTIRVLLAYRNCASLANVDAVSDEEAADIRASTTLNPTNIYEDLTRPPSMAVMVFLVQGLLIGLVMDDTYQTPTRTCFNGHDGCPMLTSLGSYSLYLMGTFMACVFYIGPRNSFGQKEQNPTFWLKLFLMTKEGSSSSVLTWTDSITHQSHALALRPTDVWLRFFQSFLVNGVGFHFLLHVLPIQVAGQSTIIGVVFRAIGMIYLADLDDTTGPTLTLVAGPATNNTINTTTEAGEYHSTSETTNYGSNGDHSLDAVQRAIVEQAVADVRAKLETLIANGNMAKGHDIVPPTGRARGKFVSITNALVLSAAMKKRKKTDNNVGSPEETLPLVL